MTTRPSRLDMPAMGICFHYYRAARSHQRDQLRRIRDLGFDVINTEESPVEPATPPGPLPAVMAWNHIEIGRHRYDWSFHDRLVEDCAAVGLKLITDVLVPFHLPNWVAEEYGDTDFVQPGGRRWGTYQRAFAGTTYEMRHFSLAHAGAAAAAADFLGRLAARYKGSATVVGHNLFQELGLNYPHSATWYGQDVSAPAVRGFEAYLQRRYATLDELNRDWGSRHGAFADAARDPAIFRWDGRPYRGWALWYDWRCEYVAKFFRGLHEAVKAADPEALTTISAAGGGPPYSVCQGTEIERLGFVDLVAEKSFGGWGAQDGMRFMYTHARLAGTGVALSNVNSYASEGDIPTWDLARRIMASVGMGSRWNSLYGWHWFTHLDPEQGVRVVHRNLEDFVPWIGFLRRHRALFAGARPPWAAVAVLAPGRSDLLEFWQNNDPRTAYKSHPRYVRSCDGIDVCYLLDSWSVNYDLLTESRLTERLDSYRLIVVGEPYLAAETAETLRAWVAHGGKMVLLPNAARFDERGQTADWFGRLGNGLVQQNVTLRLYKDYAGWESDASFPAAGSILLLERLDSLQVADILAWAGVAPELSFIDPPPPTVHYELGSCREAETTRLFYWRDHVSVYALDDARGRRLYILVQRGRDTNELKDVAIAWTGGPVQMLRPPADERLRLTPDQGRLLLPPWRDATILITETP